MPNKQAFPSKNSELKGGNPSRVFRQVRLVHVMGILILLLICAQPVLAQTGKLKVHVKPREAYVYADGKPVMEARGHTITLSVGEHKIDLYNYGYKPESRNVSIEANKTATLDVTMQAIPGTVSGPWGCITLEGADRDAVLLNGKDPAFFVGHGDEFNNEWVWKQELIVPPGKYELTVVHDDSPAWSTTVDVPANQRVVVDAHKGVRKTVAWTRGQRLQSLPRFKAGIASAAVALAKPTSQLASSASQIDCGGTAQLKWSTTDAPHVEIAGVGEVAASGEQAVQPKQTTSYKLTAAGPGGVVDSEATVNVNSSIQGSLSVTPAEIRYHKVGDQVDQQGSASLSWSAPGADTATLDPFGTVPFSGNRTVQATPQKTSPGPVDETLTYTLRSSNACGSSDTRTATLHIVGSIEVAQAQGEVVQALEVKLSLNSIYFPTSLPTMADPMGGLVPSQQQRLQELVANFKQYLELRPEAHLILQAHADRRGSAKANQALSERRAARVRSFLTEQGVAESSIETKAFGSEQNLDAATVKQLTEENPNLTPEDRQRVEKQLPTLILANNRRVDINLSTTGQKSLQYFPYNSEDLNVLLGPPPKAKAAPVKAKAKVKK